MKLLKSLTLATVIASSYAMADATATAELKQKLSGLNSFTANFNQTVFDSQNQLLQQSSGDLAIAKPNKLRWNVVSPDEELMLSDGDSLWFYNPFLEQVSVYDLEQSIAQSPFMLLTSSDESAWNNYKITKLANGYKLEPKTTNSLVWLQISLNGAAIESLESLDNQGQRSLFKLSEFNSNEKIDSAKFTFTIPTGIELDDQRTTK